MERRVAVLMSGYPASGKSTLAAALAERLGFTLIAKDLLLMTLYTAFQFAPGDAAWSLRTGAVARATFWLQARLSPRAVLDTNIQWANQQQLDDLRSLDGTLIEVRCDCPPRSPSNATPSAPPSATPPSASPNWTQTALPLPPGRSASAT